MKELYVYDINTDKYLGKYLGTQNYLARDYNNYVNINDYETYLQVVFLRDDGTIYFLNYDFIKLQETRQAYFKNDKITPNFEWTLKKAKAKAKERQQESRLKKKMIQEFEKVE